MQNILVIGSAEAQYHPLETLETLPDFLSDYNLIFTKDIDRILEMRDFAMLICYADAWKQPFSAAQSAAFKDYLSGGGKILSIHNGISIQETPELAEVTGARFTQHPEYCKLLIQPVKGHPITDSVQDFYIMDEPYHYEVYGEINILATYNFNETIIPAAWERIYGKGIMIYLMPGHDKNVFQCESYRQLIKNSIHYLLDKVD